MSLVPYALLHTVFFLFNDPPPTEIYTLSLHDALPIYPMLQGTIRDHVTQQRRPFLRFFACEEDLSHESPDAPLRSEEHTSELQSHSDLVCRLLLEKKKKK